MTDARNLKLMQLFLDEKAYVHMLSSPLNVPIHRKFIIDQFKYLGTYEPRPVRQLDSSIDRRAELNPSTGLYEWRSISLDKDRGKAKPNKLYIKAKCCTLAPQDGRIHYYSTFSDDFIALVFNSDFCEQTTINKHVYRGGGVVITNLRKRLYSRHRTSNDVNLIIQHQFLSDNQATATDKLKEYNRLNRQKGIIASYTENESVKPSRAALEHGGILAPRDDLSTRLNAFDFKNYIKQELNLDLPIAIGGPYVAVKPYTLSQQCEDLFKGIITGKSSDSYQFAKRIWESGNVTREHILALDNSQAGRWLLNLVNAKQWYIAKLILEIRNTLDICFLMESKYTALQTAIQNNQMDLVNLLFQKTDITFKNANNQSALSIALFNKNYNLIENLMNNSIIPDGADNNDQLAYAIFYLMRSAQYRLAKMILDKYSNRNLSTLTQKIDAVSKCSALHYAVFNQPSLVEKLLRMGANIALRNNNNQSPLSMAAFNNNTVLVDQLIEYSNLVEDIPENNKQLVYSLFILTFKAHYTLAEKLLDKYSGRTFATLNDCKPFTLEGHSILHYAARNLPTTAPLMEKLIKAGACNGQQNNIFVPYNQHISLLSLATTEWQDSGKVKLILRYSALQFSDTNAQIEKDEIKKASRFLLSQQQPLDLQFLIDLHGNLMNKRRVAVLILSECFYAAKNIEDVLSIFAELEKWKPEYLYDRQHNFGVSFMRSQWSGSDTSHTWIKIMEMGRARLLELHSQERNTALSTKAIYYLQQKTSGWTSKSADSSTFTLFKNMHNPIVESKLKQYIHESKNRVMGMT